MKEMETHQRENNDDSESFLQENQGKLKKKCIETYKLLKKGIRLTVKSAMNDYNISSLPRRILDLKELGVIIKDEWIRDIETGKRLYKEWFIEVAKRSTKKELQDWWNNYLNEFPETKLIQSELFKNKNETT